MRYERHWKREAIGRRRAGFPLVLVTVTSSWAAVAGFGGTGALLPIPPVFSEGNAQNEQPFVLGRDGRSPSNQQAFYSEVLWTATSSTLEPVYFGRFNTGASGRQHTP
jgi:hypothetical protein